MREKWIASFTRDKTIQLINSKDNRYLYVTGSRTYDGRSSMYHVWQENKWLICTPDYRLACRKFEEGEE